MGQIILPSAIDVSAVIGPLYPKDTAVEWTVLADDGTDQTVEVTDQDDAALATAYVDYQTSQTALLATIPKVLRYAPTGTVDDYHEIDYIRGLTRRLAPSRVFKDGTLIQVDFHADSTLDEQGQEVFGELILRETYDYTRNAEGFAIARSLNIEWVAEDGQFLAENKTRLKYYNFLESIRETDRRRSNVLDGLKTELVGLFVAVLRQDIPTAVGTGQTFFERHLSAIAAYRDIGTVTTLIDSINADAETTWLDTDIGTGATFREYVTGRLAGTIILP